MDVIDLKKYPVLILDDTLDAPSHVGKTTHEALAYLEKEGMAVERCREASVSFQTGGAYEGSGL